MSFRDLLYRLTNVLDPIQAEVVEVRLIHIPFFVFDIHCVQV